MMVPMISGNFSSLTFSVRKAIARRRAPGIAADFRDQPVFDLFCRLSRRTVVHNFKIRGNTGLKRKSFQYFLAKAVNGLDFNASRRVEQHRKQFAGAGFQFLRLF